MLCTTAPPARTGRELQRYEDGWRLVACCVPLRTDDGRVLLVSSRSGDWSLPKGGWDSDETVEAAAQREAREEAGVSGVIGPELSEQEVPSSKGVPTRWRSFVLFVTAQHTAWAEQYFRQRCWFTESEALDLVTRPYVRDLIAQAFTRLRAAPAFVDGTLAGFAPEAVLARSEMSVTVLGRVHVTGRAALRARKLRHKASKARAGAGDGGADGVLGATALLKSAGPETSPAVREKPPTSAEGAGEEAADADADGTRALLTLTRCAMDDAEVIAALSHASAAAPLARNDRFSYFRARLGAASHSVNVELVCPATDADVARLSKPKCSPGLGRETPEQYRTETRPRVQRTRAEDTAWVRAIVEGRAEGDRVLLWYGAPPPVPTEGAQWVRGPPEHGFVVVRGPKWSGAAEDVHLLCLSRSDEIWSVRDLRRRNIDMLRAMAEHLETAARTALGPAAPPDLRASLHYPPAFWWLHVHYRLADARDGRAIGLQTAISLLEAGGDDVYAAQTMEYFV